MNEVVRSGKVSDPFWGDQRINLGGEGESFAGNDREPWRRARYCADKPQGPLLAGTHRLMRGATLVRTLLYLIGGLALLLVITLGFFEGRKAYWDHRVRELCKKDGGVDVVEQVRLTVDDYRRLGGAYGEIPVPERRSAPNTAEFVSDTERHLIREGSPTVWRTEATVHAIRTNRTLARYVNYSRSGGDFPSFAHPSSFSCDQGRGSISKKIFLIEGSVE